MAAMHEHKDEALHPELARYTRQMLFAPIGVDGQRRLRQASVTLVGCGALGSVLANTLVRAGVGSLRIIDRDFIETNNLQRQTLFDEHDIAQNLPKAEAAARKLRKINSAVEVEGIVADVNPGNAEGYCRDADLILDGTDNLETRFLVNDVAVKHDIPWVYGACIAAEGLVLPIVPHRTPCLRCIWDEPPPPGMTPTCDTVGVLAAAVNIVASLQVTAAMKIVMGIDAAARATPLPSREGPGEGQAGACLLAIDAWEGRLRSINVQGALDEGDCPCCKHGRYDYLAGGKVAATTALCGRDAVQILPAADTVVNFRAIAERLPSRSNAKHNEFMLKFKVTVGNALYNITLFNDGRAIIQGTSDPSVARSVLAKYVGM